MKHYQVKFTDGKTVYGIAESFSELAKAAINRGNLLISDAIILAQYEVPEEDVQDIPMVFNNEYDQFVTEQFNKAKELNDSLPDGVHVGSLFRTPVGDGYAWYVVTKLYKVTCKVEWRGFSLDRLVDHHFGHGGSFLIQEVAKHVRRYRAWPPH